MQFKIQVSGQPTFHRANSTAQKFQAIMLSGGLMPIGDTLVTTLYLLKVLFGLVSDRGSMMKILSGLAMRGLENAFPVLIFMKTDSGSSGSQHDSAAMFHSNSEVGWRFRQLVRAQKPFEHHPDLLWVAWDEIFFHLRDTDWGAVTGYNQNRVFVGIGRIPNKRSPWRTEIGYLYQQIDIPEDSDDLNNHILSINFYFNP